MVKLATLDEAHPGLHITDDLVRCDACGFVHWWPLPDAATVVRYYSGDYFYSGDSPHSPPDWFTKERNEYEAGLWDSYYSYLASLLDPTKPVIDYGCGGGWFLDYLKGHGWGQWDLYGVEPSRTARRVSPIAHRLYERLDTKAKGNIVLSLVLEHIPDPARFLQEDVLPYLDGRLVVVVPNEWNLAQRWVNRLSVPSKKNWFISAVHINYFNGRSLRGLLERCGLKVVGESSTCPVELAIIGGYDYRGDDTRGRRMHLTRLKLEISSERRYFLCIGCCTDYLESDGSLFLLPREVEHLCYLMYNILANRVTGRKPVATQPNKRYHYTSPARVLSVTRLASVTGNPAGFLFGGKDIMHTKTPEDYHALAKEKGFRWLGPVVGTVNKKTVWLCSNGHRYEAHYNSIQQGNRCSYCTGNARKQPDDYHRLAQEKGFTWIGPTVRNNATKTTWQCVEGHTWSARYADIYMGTGCPHCSRKFRKSPKDYHDLAHSRGFEWLGPEVRNIHTRTKWKCSKGHEWITCYADIYMGRGCFYCSPSLPKVEQDYHNLAKKRGFNWVGKELPSNVGTDTLWECSKAHQWEATFNSIRRHGCPYCAGTIRKTLDDYHVLAGQRGFVWLGVELPPNIRTKTKWQCDKGHEWRATYGNIYSGNGCPTCNESKGEKAIASFLERVGIKYRRQEKFAKCRGGRQYLPFDFFFSIDGKLFLIEYDGEQHSRPVKGWGGIEKFKKTQEYDLIKSDFAKANGFILIRIPHTIKGIESFLRFEIEKHLGYSLNDLLLRVAEKRNQELLPPSPFSGWQLGLGL